MLALLAVVLAVALAALTYFRLEGLDRRFVAPFALRALAGAALALLLVNPSCAGRPEAREPLVLLDGSLSMAQRPEAWTAARARADSLGEVRLFGDDGTADSLPSAGRSRLGPALRAAAALDRPLVVVTDGELDDVGEIPPDLLARPTVEVRAREPLADVAVTAVDAPARLTVGDSLLVDVSLRAIGDAPDSAVVELRFDDAGRTRLARRALRFTDGVARATLRAPTRGLVPGEHLLTVQVAPADAEPRTDVRLVHLELAETPGIVLVADPGDWDARFLYRAVKDVARLPLRGYVRLGDGWRSMSDLALVADDEVRRAARAADLVILKGAAGSLAQGSSARGIWLWPSGATGPVEAADWYLVPGTGSPASPAFAGLPVDSFAPGLQLTAADPPASAWVALGAQAGRRGALRPAHFGFESGRTRRAVTALDGLWRWSFRGGSSEQAYRGLVATTVSWLLDTPDSASGPARPVRAVVQAGRPMVFEWTGGGTPRALAVQWSGSATATDTLRFDGAGRAELRLAPGTYRYRLEGGTQGTMAVEAYSDEWLPRPVALAAQEGRAAIGTARTAARDWRWLMGVVVLALCGEWLLRRRLGLR
ncbi:MAG TPA: hypothetical protein VFX50_04070 [Gemmatimonadales bacterium]|nr:hypothetical protein [Gemmatimonadales bacterium]